MTYVGTNHKAKVFISYSRDDIDFADQLVAALDPFGFDPLIDRHSIPGGEDWKAQLRRMIVDADSIIFVLSPRSAASKLCEWEVKEADQLNKRLIPVVCASLEDASVPPRLADLNYIYFYAAPKAPGSGFGSGLARLLEALNTDLDWIRDHTRLGALSERWHVRKKDAALLLRGDELEDAERWVARKPPSAPEPTELLRGFLFESRRAEAARLDKERQQIEEIAAAQAAREEALKRAENAQANVAAEQTRTATALARTARILQIVRWATAGIVVLAVIAGGVFSHLLAQRAQELEKSRRQLESAQVTVSQEQASNAALTDSLSKRQVELDNARANILPQLSETKLLRGEFDSALRLASLGTRIALGLPSDAVRTSFSVAALATVISQANWHASLSGDDGPVEFATFSRAGSRIVTASHNDARVWDVASVKEIAVLRGGGGSSAAFSPDGSHIVTASRNTALIWDAATAKEIAVLRGHDKAVHSAAVSSDGSRIVTASADGTARIWDAATANEIAVLRGHDKAVHSAAFNPDGSRIVTASADGTARIWDAATAKEVAVLRGDRYQVFSAAFSPDGSRIVTASEDKTAHIWDVASAIQIAVLRGHSDKVNSAVFSPDGSRIVTASEDKTARIWDAATAKEVAVLRGHVLSVSFAAFSPDGSRIVTASVDKTARIWDASAKEIAVLRGHERAVLSAAFSPDPAGSRIVTASMDKTARIWDAARAKEITVPLGHDTPVYSAVFSPDGSRIVTASSLARIWDAASAQEIAKPRGYSNVVWSAAFSRDGSRIVAASEEGVFISDVASATPIAFLSGRESASASGNNVFSAAFSPDESRIVMAIEKTASIWDVASAKEIAALSGHSAIVYSAVFSPDQSRIVTASADNTARIWDVASAKEIAVLSGHSDKVYSAVFSPDGARIVTASEDKTARIWDAATAKEIAVLRGHDKAVHSAAFSPDGSRIVTASWDNTARIWDAHLQTMSAKDLLIEACARLAGVQKLTRDEMHLATYPDSMPEIDVCQRADSGAALQRSGSIQH
jgi:WD40 repeat protein